MPKKHRKPQVRRRTKPTTGQIELANVIYMDREWIENDEGLRVRAAFGACTCGKWRSSPEATTLMKVGIEAKAHAEAGDCVLRFHEMTKEDLQAAKEVKLVDAIAEELAEKEQHAEAE
jgi:hypothetical protein